MDTNQFSDVGSKCETIQIRDRLHPARTLLMSHQDGEPNRTRHPYAILFPLS